MPSAFPDITLDNPLLAKLTRYSSSETIYFKLSEFMHSLINKMASKGARRTYYSPHITAPTPVFQSYAWCALICMNRPPAIKWLTHRNRNFIKYGWMHYKNSCGLQVFADCECWEGFILFRSMYRSDARYNRMYLQKVPRLYLYYTALSWGSFTHKQIH